MQKLRSIGVNGGEFYYFLGNFNIRFFVIFGLFLIHPMLPPIKGVGGGSWSKFFFFDDSDRKFSVLSPTFYGISKSRPEGPQFCGFSGVGGAPGGQFWPFGEI